MKKYNLILVVVSLSLLTACRWKPEPSESSDIEAVLSDSTESGTEVWGTHPSEATISCNEQEIAGTWHIDGQRTEEVNELSLLQEFGSGIHEGNGMVLSENGEFSYWIAINRGGEGVWKLDGNGITADFTTYEPEVREEQLTMTVESGEEGEPVIRMEYTDGYILFWSRSKEETSTKESGLQTTERMVAEEVPIILESDVWFEGYPEQREYDLIAALAVEPVETEEGTYGGSPVIWNSINDGNFLHFYYSLVYPEPSQLEYANFAIIGENIGLACGLHVGMSAKEAENIIPGLYHFRWGNPESVSVLDWNPGPYPDGWCQQFPQILIAEIDDGYELPKTIGLLLDEEEVIRAIAFNYPTAG